MKLSVFLSIGCATLLCIPNVRGQSITPDVMNNSGGYGVVGGTVFEWSVGEMVITTQTGTNLIVTQGLLQPTDGTVAVPDVKLASMLSVYPNPTSSIVNVSFNALSDGSLSYKLMDVTGKLVEERSFEVKRGPSIHQVDTRLLANGTYMLHVLYTKEGSAPMSSVYKIQKIN